MITNLQVRELRQELLEIEGPCLSLYVDCDPSNPDNARAAWRKRAKNALKEIEELHSRPEHGSSLYDQVIEAIEEERPESRTLVLFAWQDKHGKGEIRRFDLKVRLPVADLKEGRSEAHWGQPWVTPLLFALDEYQRAAVLHIDGSRWAFYESFLGEIEELNEVFADLDEKAWKELEEAAQFIQSERLIERVEPDKSGSTVDAWKEKTRHWMRRLYRRLADLVEKAMDERGIERLLVLGPHEQARRFAAMLPARMHERLVAILPNPSDGNMVDRKTLQGLVEDALAAAEREAEGRLLDAIREQPGFKGVEEVIEAWQQGRIDCVVVAWNFDIRLWHCPQSGLFAATAESARRFCPDPKEVRLADHVLDLAETYGTRIEFVAGVNAERLEREFGGIAGYRRW